MKKYYLTDSGTEISEEEFYKMLRSFVRMKLHESIKKYGKAILPFDDIREFLSTKVHIENVGPYVVQYHVKEAFKNDLSIQTEKTCVIGVL